MELENRLYTEEELVDINADYPLSVLDYFLHHETMKAEYEAFCAERDIPVNDEASADSYQTYIVDIEEHGM